MNREPKKLDYGIAYSAFVFFVYLLSIFAINIIGRAWVNYDISSDALLAKYIALNKTLFPKEWHFGNQIYVTATPVVAALFYPLFDDSYSALALASCVMTMLTVGGYIWCIKPFVKRKGIIVSLLVLIGGTNIGISAHAYVNGFQLFYTMASYYACYVVGIFVTLGVYLRLLNNMPVNKIVQMAVILLNAALGIQSLRELLVLNLPLCAMALLQLLSHYRDIKSVLHKQKKSNMFVVLALLANLCGVLFSKQLVLHGIIKQNTILLSAGTNWWENIKHSLAALTNYIGLVAPTDLFSVFQSMVAIFSIIIVGAALACVIVEYHKTKKVDPIGFSIIFFLISLIAVFCSGVVVITLRSIYYFCWYSFVSVSVIYLIEQKWEKHQSLLVCLKHLLVLGLLCVSVLNYVCTFVVSLKNASETRAYYQRIVTQLQADGIKYLYSDWRTEQNMIVTMSRDEILYGTLAFTNDSDDLWMNIDYLYLDSWFDEANFETAYIVMSDAALSALENDFSPEYRREFMSNLEFVYEFSREGMALYFYRGSPKMFEDMVN